MRYYVKETDKSNLLARTAGVKARADAEKIFDRNGLKAIEIPSIIENRESISGIKKIKAHYDLYRLWKSRLNHLKKNDWVYIQFPLVEHTILFFRVVREAERRGVHVAVLIHDVESMRTALRSGIPYKKRKRLKYEEYSVFNECSQVIVHNDCMKALITDKLGISEEKIRVLMIFDYLIDGYKKAPVKERIIQKEAPVIIAGALVKHKVGYVYSLPDNQDFNLYGIGYEEENKPNINYRGAFDPDELPYVLEGSFGLVWDGDSPDTCSGVYGEYLKVNNPHKTSLYLAAGIPVIIWREAALAKLVKEKECGIAVDSLYDISEITHSLQEEDYAKLRANAEKCGEHLREGYFLSQILSETDELRLCKSKNH